MDDGYGGDQIIADDLRQRCRNGLIQNDVDRTLPALRRRSLA